MIGPIAAIVCAILCIICEGVNWYCGNPASHLVTIIWCTTTIVWCAAYMRLLP